MTSPSIHLTKPLRFLVVDDSRAIQAIIQRAISKCGYEPIEIKTALNGEQALDLVDSFAPDLVITDWHMPKVSGLEMVQAMRQSGHQDIRVGLVTTEKNPALLDEALRNGVRFILHKPFDDAELVELVRAAVQDLVSVDAAPPPPLESKPAVREVALPPEAPVKGLLDPVLAASLQTQINTCLGNIPFRLITHEKMTQDKLTANLLLGLYGSSDRKGVYCIGVLDANAVCMLGGGAARKSPGEVRTAMASGQPDPLMLTKAHDFLRSCAACLGETATKAALPVTLAKASIVKNSFAKLAEVLVQTNNRSDFRISIPGYGEGRLAFFVMSV